MENFFHSFRNSSSHFANLHQYGFFFQLLERNFPLNNILISSTKRERETYYAPHIKINQSHVPMLIGGGLVESILGGGIHFCGLFTLTETGLRFWLWNPRRYNRFEGMGSENIHRSLHLLGVRAQSEWALRVVQPHRFRHRSKSLERVQTHFSLTSQSVSESVGVNKP